MNRSILGGRPVLGGVHGIGLFLGFRGWVFRGRPVLGLFWGIGVLEGWVF
jgi:hypothetical protein